MGHTFYNDVVLLAPVSAVLLLYLLNADCFAQETLFYMFQKLRNTHAPSSKRRAAGSVLGHFHHTPTPHSMESKEEPLLGEGPLFGQ